MQEMRVQDMSAMRLAAEVLDIISYYLKDAHSQSMIKRYNKYAMQNPSEALTPIEANKHDGWQKYANALKTEIFKLYTELEADVITANDFEARLINSVGEAARDINHKRWNKFTQRQGTHSRFAFSLKNLYERAKSDALNRGVRGIARLELRQVNAVPVIRKLADFFEIVHHKELGQGVGKDTEENYRTARQALQGLQAELAQLDTQIGRYQPHLERLDEEIRGLETRLGGLGTPETSEDQFLRPFTDKIAELKTAHNAATDGARKIEAALADAEEKFTLAVTESSSELAMEEVDQKPKDATKEKQKEPADDADIETLRRTKVELREALETQNKVIREAFQALTQARQREVQAKEQFSRQAGQRAEITTQLEEKREEFNAINDPHQEALRRRVEIAGAEVGKVIGGLHVEAEKARDTAKERFDNEKNVDVVARDAVERHIIQMVIETVHTSSDSKKVKGEGLFHKNDAALALKTTRERLDRFYRMTAAQREQLRKPSEAMVRDKQKQTTQLLSGSSSDDEVDLQFGSSITPPEFNLLDEPMPSHRERERITLGLKPEQTERSFTETLEKIVGSSLKLKTGKTKYHGFAHIIEAVAEALKPLRTLISEASQRLSRAITKPGVTAETQYLQRSQDRIGSNPLRLMNGSSERPAPRPPARSDAPPVSRPTVIGSGKGKEKEEERDTGKGVGRTVNLTHNRYS